MYRGVYAYILYGHSDIILYMMSQYLQVIWLYVIGIMIILVGIYLLMLNSGPASFIVMLVGLAVSAIGAAHGKKMREMGMVDVQQMAGGGVVPAEQVQMQYPVQQRMPQKVQAAQQLQVKARVLQTAEEQRAEEQPTEEDGSAPQGILGIFKRQPQEQAEPKKIMELEMEDVKSGKLVPTQADIIELVCPKCAAENDERNFYCYYCGNKLRRKPSKEGGLKKPSIQVEPGSIKIVGEKRIAKVMICPKCNVPNVEADKFCHNCGKKLKTERLPKGKGKARRSARLAKEPLLFPTRRQRRAKKF